MAGGVGSFNKQQTPLDLLSNCALEEITNTISISGDNTVSSQDLQQHSDPDTTIFYTSAVTEAEINSANASVAQNTPCVAHGTEAIFYIDSKGNLLNSSHEMVAPPEMEDQAEEISASILVDERGNYIPTGNEGQMHGHAVSICGEVADNLPSPEAHHQNLDSPAVILPFSIQNSSQSSSVVEVKVASPTSSASSPDSPLPLPIILKRNRKPTPKGQIYRSSVRSRGKKFAVECEEDSQSEAANEVPVEKSRSARRTVRRKTQSNRKSVPKTSRKKENAKIQTVYECKKCPKTFPQYDLLKIHFQSHKPGTSGDSLSEDQSNNFGEQISDLECSICSRSFSCHNELNDHLPIHEMKVNTSTADTFEYAAEKFKCSLCPNTYAHSSSFKAHMRFHRGEKPYRCTECGVDFAQSGHLMIHKRIHTGEKPYTCDICFAQFKQISHLKTHVRTHTHDKPYKCNLCTAAFAQNSSLKRHKRSHTGEKPYKCNTCGMEFVVKSNLVRHSYTHSGKKPYSCNLCSASFGQVIDLRRHKISHTGLKPFKCDLCEATFSRKNNLKWHKLTHAEGASYQCDVCNVMFSSPGDLRFHKRSHEPPKPYPCKLCPAAFQQPCSLKNHELIHTSNFPSLKKSKNKPKDESNNSPAKPFACDYCNASFSEKRNWKRHMISMHSNVDVSDKKPSLLKNSVKYESSDFQSSLATKLKEEKPSEAASPKQMDSYTLAYENSQPIEVQQSVLGEVMAPEGLSGEQNIQMISGVVTMPQNNQQNYQQLVLQSLPNNTNNNCTVVNLINAAQMGAVLVNNSSVLGINDQQLSACANINSNVASPLIISTNPDEPAKQAKPAGDCPNHSAHILTVVDAATNQFQAWCICNNSHVSAIPSCDAQTNGPAVVSVLPPAPVVASDQPLNGLVSPSGVLSNGSGLPGPTLMLVHPNSSRNAIISPAVVQHTVSPSTSAW